MTSSRAHRGTAWTLARLIAFLLAAPLLIGAVPAQAQDPPIRIGFLLSRGDGFSTSDRAGALMGEEEMNLQAQAADKRFQVLFARGGHSTEVVAEAKHLIDKEGVRALMGSVSDAATIALADLAQEKGIVFFNIGNDVDSLRGPKCRRNAFSIGPSLTMRVRALGLWAIQAKEWKSWVILQGDSKGEGRLADAARLYAEANGAKVLATLNVSEPESHDPGTLLEKLRGLNPQFVFVALSGEKQQLVLEAYQLAGLTFPIGGAEPELVRIGRDTARFTGYWSAGWSHLNRIFGASELNNRFVDFAGLPMDERAWAAWAGVKVLGEAMLRAKSSAAEDLVPYLRDKVQFDGYVGTALTFRPWDQQLRQMVTIVKVNHDAPWNGWDSVVPESSVPFRGMKGWKGDPLDAVGFTAEESGCKF
jgi:ABC-type branched-subunit amino acid transport system substrate-binding protein